MVIATAPWFLLPGAQPGQFVVLLRLARLARLVMATRGARRLLERLGRVAAVAIGIVAVGSLASFFRFGNGSTATESSASEPEPTTATHDDAALAALTTEVTALRRQVEALTERLAEAPRDLARQDPPPGADAPG